jgi:competence protein ComEA
MTNKINLNQATQDEIMKVPGIGPKEAERIVQYRQEHGGFRSVDELDNVWRVSGSEFEKARDYFEV